MRTTLTLDDDVAALLKRAREKRNTNLREIVNEALREGLARMTAPNKPSRRYRTPAVSLGRCLVGSLDDVAEALAVAEGEAFR
ncbi:MAG: CopG family transcriptional regulator [Acidobacteriota bacterium]